MAPETDLNFHQSSRDAGRNLKVQRISRWRIVAAILTLTPALLVAGIQLIAQPDPEYWLSQQAKGYARGDAFDGVSQIMPLFTVFFVGTSVLAAFFILSRKSNFLTPLAAGPSIATFVYLIMHGITDPSWFTLLLLLTIGMLVGSPVTAIWAAVTRNST
jgi:hypothetical protein